MNGHLGIAGDVIATGHEMHAFLDRVIAVTLVIGKEPPQYKRIDEHRRIGHIDIMVGAWREWFELRGQRR